MNKTTITLAVALAATLIPTGTHADTAGGCEVVDYQGAPLEMCPPVEPDPTNCYTGWYQGAPIEICMAPGVTLPEGTTYHDGTPWAGQPVVIHDRTGHVRPEATPPTTTPPTATAAAAPVTTAPVTTPAPLAWLDDLQARLVENGGW